MRETDTLIWDWNGTLLDDVDICLDSINLLLSKRNLPVLRRERYRSIFRFPVEKYYSEAGFDFSAEPFDILAQEFIGLYLDKLPEAGLFPDAKNTLEILRKNGYRQFLVSAMEHDTLRESLSLRELLGCFTAVKGIEDHYARGKTKAAMRLIEEFGLDVSTTCLIGDTDHDQEVARELGCRCLLISGGHQSRQRLLKLNGMVLQELAEVPGHFCVRTGSEIII
ncbi:MAG: HAD family hydrolase [Bacteroidales bacterium]|nr:HAD family hydrolase [Bacteroidales bacterium]